MKVSMWEQQMQGVSRRDESNPKDTIHFYALCLREAGVIKSNPQKIISKGSDWRFLTEITRELTG
jgi:NitT/TauT family transport system substrate-binding protein